MGKRKRTEIDNYDVIARKVKKLEKMLLEAREKNSRKSSSSSCDSSSSETSSSSSDSSQPRSGTYATIHHQETLSIEDVPIQSSEATVSLPPTDNAPEHLQRTDTIMNSVPSTSSSGYPPPVTDSTDRTLDQVAVTTASMDQESAPIELTDDVLKILGEDPSQRKAYSSNIQPELAIRLEHIATTGLNKEERKNLLDKYLPPVNCTLIDAPTLNLEVKAAISDAVIKRDQGIEFKQKQLCAATACIADTLSHLMAEANNTLLIQKLMDACKLLCDTQHTDSRTRRGFIISNIKREIKEQIQATKIDKLLFSEGLCETIRTAKAISKSGADMKIPTVKKVVKTTYKNNQRNLNFRGPPPHQTRHKGIQRTKDLAYKNPQGNSWKQSSRPAPSHNRR